MFMTIIITEKIMGLLLFIGAASFDIDDEDIINVSIIFLT